MFLRPLLHAALALTFLASGAVGLMTPVAAVESLFEAGGLPQSWAGPLALGGSLADVALGLWLLLARRPLAAMAALVAG
ncbi:MAG TPA: DoxX-like family protein [Chiayiivirga sp.]|nr:DoxX-like family protein [Chiayiivirga sp.]